MRNPFILPSRRSAVNLLVLIMLACLTACGVGSVPQGPTEADMQINAATDALFSIRSQEASLSWFAQADSMASNAFGRRTSSDAELLSARLYHDLAQQLSNSAQSPPTDRAGVRSVITTSPVPERRPRVYYDELLDDTRNRMSRDASFQRDIRRASVAARLYWKDEWDSYKCMIDGMPMPMIHCKMYLSNFWYESWNVVAGLR